jgi:hypothetical protein
MFQTKPVAAKIKTHILFPITFFFLRKSCRLCDNVDKFCRSGLVTDDNTAHAHCVLDTYVYIYTLRMYTTCCLPLQQCLHECASLLCYTCIACLILELIAGNVLNNVVSPLHWIPTVWRETLFPVYKTIELYRISFKSAQWMPYFT